MRTNPKFWSDEFEVFDDPDFIVFYEDGLCEPQGDEPNLGLGDRQVAMWQQIEPHLIRRQLGSELDDWDYWDEYLAVH